LSAGLHHHCSARPLMAPHNCNTVHLTWHKHHRQDSTSESRPGEDSKQIMCLLVLISLMDNMKVKYI